MYADERHQGEIIRHTYVEITYDTHRPFFLRLKKPVVGLVVMIVIRAFLRRRQAEVMRLRALLGLGL